MLRRVGQIKEMFGAKYLIQSSRKSLSISALQSARYDKIDRNAKMIEIKNENNPAKKKALMRDLLRGYEVKKGPVQNVPNLGGFFYKWRSIFLFSRKTETRYRPNSFCIVKFTKFVLH